MEHFDEKKFTRDLKIDARAINLPSGSADVFIAKTLEGVKKHLKNKTLITKNDLKRITTKELKKYNADLAYIYKNRDKII